eukprot:2331531-Prorocentrum_lima.AAC.1
MRVCFGAGGATGGAEAKTAPAAKPPLAKLQPPTSLVPKASCAELPIQPPETQRRPQAARQ